MGIGSNRTGNLMFFRKFPGIPVELLLHAAGVVDFYCVDQGKDFEQIIFLPAPCPHAVIGVGDADKGALFFQPLITSCGGRPAGISSKT